MKLKTLNKVLCSVKYELVVFEKKTFVTSFIVDYLAENGKDNILRLCAIENIATVSTMYVSSETGLLTINVRI